MPPVTKSEKVPLDMKEKYEEIVSLTDAFSEKYLNDEYAQLIRYATASLCRKKPSPLKKGKAGSWACGVTHAIGTVNFVFDRTQNPHVKSGEIYDYFGVASSTGQGKSKQVRDLLDTGQMDPNWSLQSIIADNPMVWMISVNGMMVDVRSAPLELQELAYEKGLIPYVPAYKEG